MEIVLFKIDGFLRNGKAIALVKRCVSCFLILPA
ncbi:hypothetical protein T07_6883 [Trichinella nelsoni]|uniref:Uncharacterized protein n=1 Tax=Trichinella nelsoni TaxID=6336 RepID=A0A0V0SGD8_9BILA|nr:hypothetical protein T07_6883 [Trichinella nelsoni]